MKNLYLTAVFTFFSLFLTWAQSPEQFNYQAVIRNSGGNILANQSVGIKFNIRQSTAAGSIVFSETFATTTNEYGMVNLQIGSGTTVTGTIAGINWGTGPYFLEFLVDAAGGSNYTAVGTSQLLSVPYALYAKNSGGNYWKSSTNNTGISYDQGNVVVGQQSIAAYDKFFILSDEADVNASNLVLLNKNAATQTRMTITNNAFNSLVFGLNNSSSPYGANEGFLFYFNNYDFKIGVGGIERMRFKSDGKIGIGTTDPKSQLQVKGGDIYLEDANAGVIMKSPNGNCWKLTVDNSGNPVFTTITCP